MNIKKYEIITGGNKGDHIFVESDSSIIEKVAYCQLMSETIDGCEGKLIDSYTLLKVLTMFYEVKVSFSDVSDEVINVSQLREKYIGSLWVNIINNPSLKRADLRNELIKYSTEG